MSCPASGFYGLQRVATLCKFLHLDKPQRPAQNDGALKEACVGCLCMSSPPTFIKRQHKQKK